MDLREIETTWAPRMLSVLRVVAALLFISHGIQKLAGFPAPPSFGLPAMGTLLWFAAIIEIVGGAFLLVGLLTRPVAFLLSGQMAIAYFLAHAPRSFYPLVNGGEAAILYCFVFLFLAVAGGGIWSVDAMLRRSGRAPAYA